MRPCQGSDPDMAGTVKAAKPRADASCMRLVLLVCVALALGLVFFKQQEARAEEDRFGDVASEIARRDVSVRCQGAVGAALDVTWEDGSVWFDARGKPADVTDLKRHVCKTLAAFPDRPDDEETVRSVNTLAHESWHLAGVRNESAAECYAIQTIELTAKRLGADDARARQLALAFLVTQYERMPSAYRSAECRDGGDLDLHRDSPVWP